MDRLVVRRWQKDVPADEEVASMKIGLVLSNDWELFGNGAGDYFEIQHHPLQQLLDVVEGYGAPLTVMAEIGQQWAHQRLGEHESWARDIACAWELILQDTIRMCSSICILNG
jgi:hypothetical protein